jgi:hypothetical protein
LKLPLQFSLRELLLVTTVVALAVALWQTSLRVPPAAAPGNIQSQGGYRTVVGPLKVTYRIRSAPNSTHGSNDVPIKALHFLEGAVIFEYENGRRERYEAERLETLEWRPE